MFLKPGTPGRQQVGLLQTRFSLQLCQLLPRSPLLQLEGPKAWPGHTCPCGKSGGGSKRQSPSPLLRRGRVSLHQLLCQPSCLGPQRSRRERGSLLSWGKSSDQWPHATQVVHTSAHKPNYNPLLLAGLSPEWIKWSNLLSQGSQNSEPASQSPVDSFFYQMEGVERGLLKAKRNECWR